VPFVSLFRVFRGKNFMKKKTFVTFLTLVRAPLVLLAAVCALCHAWWPSRELLIVFVALMGLSALTDMFDGLLARKWNVTSTFGALADPLMDKVFYVATLPTAIFLAMKLGDVTHALVLLGLDIVSMLRDQWVSFLRSIGVMYGADVKANWAGKLRTAMAFPIIMAVYIDMGVQFMGITTGGTVRMGIFALEGALLLITVLSAWIYTCGYWKYLKKATE